MEIQLIYKTEVINIKIYRNDNQANMLNRQILTGPINNHKEGFHGLNLYN